MGFSDIGPPVLGSREEDERVALTTGERRKKDLDGLFNLEEVLPDSIRWPKPYGEMPTMGLCTAAAPFFGQLDKLRVERSEC
jgi:hypothetical protein